MRSRYGPWDGSQDPLGERVDVAEVLDQLADDLLMGAGGRDAVRELQRRGLPGSRGTDALARELAARRQAWQQELDRQGDPLGPLRDGLGEVVETERQALAQADDPDARLAELDLDTMPTDPAGRFRALSGYDFRSPDAAAAFEQLAEELRRDVLDAHLRALTGALSSVTAEDQARIAAMLGDLNALLEARAANGGVPPADEAERFAAFLARHGDLLPPVLDRDGRPRPPADLDELLATMAHRAAEAAAFLDSLPPDQRRQLEELAAQAFDDLDLQFQLGQLGGNLHAAYPHGLPAEDGVADRPGAGDAAGPIGAAVDAHARLAELEELEQAVRGDHPGATLDDVDEEALRRHLGDDAVGDLRRLQAIERELERSGAVRAAGGELELTPRGARTLGERSLARLLQRIRKQPATRTVGADPEPTGQTRPWTFGDREPLSVGTTVRNAVMREAAGGGRVGRGVRLHPDDLEVTETEVRPRTATALLLDLSFSMPLQGHFVPAKRMALALHALIAGSHRQDSLHLIGFSDYARRMQPADLAAAGFERVYGTNMHHAFLLARRVLADDPRLVKRVVMVTDGEPTAHLVDGQSRFHWPPVAETLEVTLREAMRLARADIELDIFLLEDAPGLVAFAQRLAEVTGGEVLRMSADEVGRTVVSSYRSGVRRAR